MRHRMKQVFLPSFPFLIVALGLALPLTNTPGAPGPRSGETTSKTPAGVLTGVEVQCVDGSVMKLKIVDERVTLRTPYGVLLIPVGKINEIQFATRIPDNISKRIDQAIGHLSHEEFKKREEASEILGKLKLRAYPALLKAEQIPDLEVKKRVRTLLDKLQEDYSPEELTIRTTDTIHTDDSRIAGTIDLVTFRVESEQFGEVRLKVSDIREMRNLLYKKKETVAPSSAQPDPGHLGSFQTQIGKVFSFTVTGAVVGRVWGTDVYTLDSTLAAAALHAGVVKMGETKVVKVKILPPRNGFNGSTKNGVVSVPYANYPGAFEFVKN